MGPKGLYHICIIISHLYHHISSVSSVSQYMYLCNHHIACIRPQKTKVSKHWPKASMYVFRQAPTASHLISYVSLYSSRIICITVSEGEGYCLMIFQTTLYTHVHKHIITPEISFLFNLTFLKCTQFYYHAFTQKR